MWNMNECTQFYEWSSQYCGDTWKQQWTYDFGFFSGFDIAFGLLGRSEFKGKLCSSQEENININVGVILSSNV